jgi:hypothetical protein
LIHPFTKSEGCDERVEFTLVRLCGNTETVQVGTSLTLFVSTHVFRLHFHRGRFRPWDPRTRPSRQAFPGFSAWAEPCGRLLAVSPRSNHFRRELDPLALNPDINNRSSCQNRRHIPVR